MWRTVSLERRWSRGWPRRAVGGPQATAQPTHILWWISGLGVLRYAAPGSPELMGGCVPCPDVENGFLWPCVSPNLALQQLCLLFAQCRKLRALFGLSAACNGFAVGAASFPWPWLKEKGRTCRVCGPCRGVGGLRRYALPSRACFSMACISAKVTGLRPCISASTATMRPSISAL